MHKLKHATTSALFKAHKHSHKTKLVIETAANVFVAIETHLIALTALLVVWSLVNVIDLIEEEIEA